MTLSKVKAGFLVKVNTGKHKGFVGKVERVNKRIGVISLTDLFKTRNLKKKDRDGKEQLHSKKVFEKIDVSNVTFVGSGEQKDSSEKKV